MATTKKKKDSKKPVEPKNIKATPLHIPSPAKAYSMQPGNRGSRATWEAPEWDLAECGVIVDTESIVRRAFKIKKNLFTKEGFEITGKNPERVKYIEKRFQQMEEATGIPLPSLINRTIASLLQCNNSYLIKVRNFDRSGGRLRKYGNKLLEPVAGYFPAPAESIYFKRNDKGRILRYKQIIRGQEEKKYSPEDVIHFYLDKREGFAVATPSLVPVKDDIRALRRIEENVELLIHQHLFPLFHYIVGNDEKPAGVLPDGSDELQAVKVSMQEMPTDGCWVTSERHQIKVLGAEGNALAVDKFMEYFKKRIYTGLGVSSVDMGDGSTASRSTASTMSRNLVDDIKADQRELGAQIYTHIIMELLLESTFDQETLFDEENKVYFRFNEIDIEHRIKKENHAADMFLKNGLTHGEYRVEMGRKSFLGEGWPTSGSKSAMFTKGDGEWGDTNYGLIERDKIILQSIDEPGTEAAQTVSKSTASKNNATASTTKSSGGNSVSSKNNPTNQYGSRGGPKFNKDFENNLNILNDILYTQVIDSYLSMKPLKEKVEHIFSIAVQKAEISIRKSFRDGLRIANADILDVDIINIDTTLTQSINLRAKALKEDIVSSIKRNTLKSVDTKYKDASIIDNTINSLMNRAKNIDTNEMIRAYNYGFILGTLAKDKDNSIEFIVKCNNCDEYSLKYNHPDDIIYNELPPLHHNCNCVISKL